jgi:hypothetical protein
MNQGPFQKPRSGRRLGPPAAGTLVRGPRSDGRGRPIPPGKLTETIASVTMHPDAGPGPTLRPSLRQLPYPPVGPDGG